MNNPFRVLRLPRKLRVTFPGKWFLALTVGVGAAAINTGNNLLYLALSMNLSLIILSGILSEWCLRGLRVRVGHVSESFASRESLLCVTCSAESRRFPAISVSVEGTLGEVRTDGRGNYRLSTGKSDVRYQASFSAVGKPALFPDAARFLSLYHRDRFGPHPLSPGNRPRQADSRKNSGEGCLTDALPTDSGPPLPVTV